VVVPTVNFVDLSEEVVIALSKAFHGVDNVTTACVDFTTLKEYDCIISPANSFGMMDGGFDGAITRYFGKVVMERVQERILIEYAGEQPIGTAFTVWTDHIAHPYCIHAPTMRVPADIRGTDNVYRAFKAVLIEASQQDEINSIACSGFGTLTGKVPADVAARQMRLAYDHVTNPIESINWNRAQQRSLEIDQAAGANEQRYDNLDWRDGITLGI
jgi:O-acetyl-ADP-ribose deacetylase (regulator of RNase III)